MTTLKLFASVKTYGPLEFFTTVLAINMVAPTYGKHSLKDFLLNKTTDEKTDVEVFEKPI